jgi:hypothetical protein
LAGKIAILLLERKIKYKTNRTNPGNYKAWGGTKKIRHSILIKKNY